MFLIGYLIDASIAAMDHIYLIISLFFYFCLFTLIPTLISKWSVLLCHYWFVRLEEGLGLAYMLLGCGPISINGASCKCIRTTAMLCLHFL